MPHKYMYLRSGNKVEEIKENDKPPNTLRTECAEPWGARERPNLQITGTGEEAQVKDTKSIFNKITDFPGTGVMAQRLKAHSILSEDLSSYSRTHIW